MAPKKVKNVEPVEDEITTEVVANHTEVNGAGDGPKPKGRGRPKKPDGDKPVAKESKPAASGVAKPRGRPAANKVAVNAAAENGDEESSGDDVIVGDGVSPVKKGRTATAAAATTGGAKRGRGRPPKNVNGN